MKSKPTVDGIRTMKRMSVVSLMGSLVAVPLMASVIFADTPAQATEQGEELPLPFFQQNCVKCHNADEMKGGIRLDNLSATISTENVETWEEVLHNVQRGDMPPEDERQPSAEARAEFSKATRMALVRFEADTEGPPDPLLRLTNRQIAYSVQDILGVSMDITPLLIQDPVDKHGFSMQSELDISGSYLQLYFDALRKAVPEAVPDPDHKERVYQVVGNDWERHNYLTKWELRRGSPRRLYRGDNKKWLGEAFKLPLVPQHEHKMFLDDNRQEGSFRIRLFVRNEPATGDGEREPQVISVFLDNGFLMQYDPVGSVIVPPKEGVQEFSFTGNLRDYTGVSPGAPEPGEKNPQTLSSWQRILSIQNNNPIEGYPTLSHWLPERHAPFYAMRGDDLWIEAFGKNYCRKNGIIGNHGGVAAARLKTNSAPPIYPEVMKKQGHVILERVEFEAPFHESWPPPMFRRFLSEDGTPKEQFAQELFEVASQIWRRSLSESDKAYIADAYRGEIAAGNSGPETLRNLLIILLSDPKFLYLNRDSEAPVNNRVLMARRQLVNRLAYFLWNGPPDQMLIDLADANPNKPLAKAEILKQVDRLLADTRAKRFVEEFTGHWIGFKTFEQVAVNPNFYPKWRNSLKADMRNEAVVFLSTLLREDLSCLNLLESDFVTVNEPLSRHYGIDNPVRGLSFQKVSAPANRGGGVLAMGAVLQGYSNGEDAHAVNRGVWLRARLLGDPPSEPPPDAGSLADQSEEDQTSLSVKQALEKHRSVAACNDCHRNIDPWGIAMEGFDAVGLPRDQILRIGKDRRMVPVVKQTKIDGTAIDGLADLKRYLREQRADDFAYGFSRHLFSHALGRKPDYRDDEQIKELQTAFAENDHRLRDLIKAIVTSPEFFGVGKK